MPRNDSIHSILVLGSGPIVIGQACEFDYSGTQAVKALAREGYRVILVNSNPATIMTDADLPGSASPAGSSVEHATYIEPLTVDSLARILEIERPDAILPTVGGQTAINLTLDLAEAGLLERYDVRLLGANLNALRLAEDRLRFKDAMIEIGLDVARSGLATSLDEAHEIAATLGYPVVVRPSFTLGGMGSGIAYTPEEFTAIVTRGLELSPVSQLLVEESVLGWKEFELEVMRDCRDQAVVVCSIENFDPMGVHTGDSITVAPAQTLTDREYQKMRDQAFQVIRKVGVETGGSNIQFALHPVTRRIVVIEMNPRVSRSSALASKATGFPIAKIAARLAVGYTLDEVMNDITKKTPACFEPALDYVVVKIPRWNFEKFPGAKTELGTQMKSVGEVMAIGRTFQEALQKGLRSLEMATSRSAEQVLAEIHALSDEALAARVSKALPDRIHTVREAIRRGIIAGAPAAALGSNRSVATNGAGASVPAHPSSYYPANAAVSTSASPDFSVEGVHRLTTIEPWFLQQIESILRVELDYEGRELSSLTADEWRTLKRLGFSDRRLARLLRVAPTQQAEAGATISGVTASAGVRMEGARSGSPSDPATVAPDTNPRPVTLDQTVRVRNRRQDLGVRPIFRRIDTCAGEFASHTPYLYSTYESQCEANPTNQRKVLILGGGPIRIGQGIEFDYCACHAAFALRDAGIESVLLNCNPETVSTDYDTADRLYFEPVTFEDVMNVVEVEKPEGVVVQFGGQTPLNIAHELESAGVRILGTSVDSIDLAEDRNRFAKLLQELDIARPEMGVARNLGEALAEADRIGYPVIVRPSYVLGGRAMQVVYDADALRAYAAQAIDMSPTHPLFLDRFLEDAFEVDVDALCDGEDVFVAGVQQHIEEAGIHSGDSACVLPPYKVDPRWQTEMVECTTRLARSLRVVGLLNVQFAIKDDVVYVIEANPRASRTIPYVAKAIGLPLVRLAMRVIVGEKLRDLLDEELLEPLSGPANDSGSPGGHQPEEPAKGAGPAGRKSRVPMPPRFQRLLPGRVFVKMPVFSSNRFPEVDTLLGPEMRSTGEVLGIGRSFGEAYAKAALSAGVRVPLRGTAFVSVHDTDKHEVVPIVRDLLAFGFHVVATRGTAEYLRQAGVPVERIFKVNEGHPNIADLLARGEVQLVMNTPLGRESYYDEAAIRRAALAYGVPCITTLSGSRAMVDAIRTLRSGDWDVKSMQALGQGSSDGSELRSEGHSLRSDPVTKEDVRL